MYFSKVCQYFHIKLQTIDVIFFRESYNAFHSSVANADVTLILNILTLTMDNLLHSFISCEDEYHLISNLHHFF